MDQQRINDLPENLDPTDRQAFSSILETLDRVQSNINIMSQCDPASRAEFSSHLDKLVEITSKKAAEMKTLASLGSGGPLGSFFHCRVAK